MCSVSSSVKSENKSASCDWLWKNCFRGAPKSPDLAAIVIIDRNNNNHRVRNKHSGNWGIEAGHQDDEGQISGPSRGKWIVCGREHDLNWFAKYPHPQSNNNNRNDGTGVESALKDKRRRRLCYDYAVDVGAMEERGWLPGSGVEALRIDDNIDAPPFTYYIASAFSAIFMRFRESK